MPCPFLVLSLWNFESEWCSSVKKKKKSCTSFFFLIPLVGFEQQSPQPETKSLKYHYIKADFQDKIGKVNLLQSSFTLIKPWTYLVGPGRKNKENINFNKENVKLQFLHQYVYASFSVLFTIFSSAAFDKVRKSQFNF